MSRIKFVAEKKINKYKFDRWMINLFCELLDIGGIIIDIPSSFSLWATIFVKKKKCFSPDA